jgi:hypothetical protein
MMLLCYYVIMLLCYYVIMLYDCLNFQDSKCTSLGKEQVTIIRMKCKHEHNL